VLGPEGWVSLNSSRGEEREVKMGQCRQKHEGTGILAYPPWTTLDLGLPLSGPQ
jgi:hypothetical protein